MFDAFSPIVRDSTHPYVLEAHMLGRAAHRAAARTLRQQLGVHSQKRSIIYGYWVAPQDHREPHPSPAPTKSVFHKTIRASGSSHVSVSEPARAKIAEVTESIHSFIKNNNLETKDSVQIAVIDDPHWHSRLPHEPYQHIRVIFFEIIDGKFYVLRWKDESEQIKPTYVVHVFHKGEETPLRTLKMVPYRLVLCEQVDGEFDSMPAAGVGKGEARWFFGDRARFIPFKSMRNWEEIARGQPGTSLEEIAEEAEEYFKEAGPAVPTSFASLHE